MTSRNEESIDDHVSLTQSKKAVTALMKHARSFAEKKAETELLPGKEQHVWLVSAVKKMQPNKKLKPQKIPLKHPLVDPRTTAVCLITKDPQREYKDLLEEHKIKFISRVVGIEKLKGKFKGFDARRLLLRENGLFLADDRVIPLLPRLLGKLWFKAKKQPIPVSLTKKDLKTELETAISSTYMHQNQGTCTSVKIATLAHDDSQILENLKTAIPAVVARVHDGWDNVQSLHIKTSESVSLPIWTCPLGNAQPGTRWAGMTKEVDDGEDWTGFNDGVKQLSEKTPKDLETGNESHETVSSSITTLAAGDATKEKKKQIAKGASTSSSTLPQKELKQKKETLDGAILTKKKDKLKETEKSTRKSAKAKLIRSAVKAS